MPDGHYSLRYNGNSLNPTSGLTLLGIRSRRSCFGWFRVQQFSEAGIISHVLEVRIVAGLKPVVGIQANGFAQVLQGTFYLARKAIQHRETIKRKICLGILLEDLLQVG